MSAMIFLGATTLVTAFSNLFIRMTVEKSAVKKDDAFLYRMLSAAVFVWFLYLPEIVLINWFSLFFGIITGLFYALMMYGVTTAQTYGSSSLIFSLQNGCTLLPPIILSLLFGAEMGFNYKWMHLGGGLLVILGFLGAFYQKESKEKNPLFYRYLFLMLFAQTALIFFLQFSDVLRKNATSLHPLIFANLHQGEVHGVFPIFFTSAFLFSLFFLKRAKDTEERVGPNRTQVIYAILGGMLGALGGKILDIALHYCKENWENLIIMPMLAVSQIFLCSLFGVLLYKEKVRWLFLFLAMAGIFFSLF